MKSKTLVVVSAVLIFFHLLGHAVGHMGWDKPEDPKMQEVVHSMKSYSSPFMGATKSMADYFQGYSLIMFGVYGMAIAILILLYSRWEESLGAKGLLLPMGLAFVYFGVVEYLYFFPLAAMISLLSGTLLIVSFFRK